MSEIIEPVVSTETPTESPETPANSTDGETPAVTSSSVLNSVVEAVMDMIDGLNNFALITRGALGADNGLSCEIAPGMVETVFMDKNTYIPLTLAINGKHHNLQTLSDTLNNILDNLTRRTSYTGGNGWEIVDITNGNIPRIIGREDNNFWIMNCDLIVKIYRKDDQVT